MAQHGHLSREEKKKIRIERKKLRKDLRLKGITKRSEFEEIAQMLGLVYYEDYPRLLGFFWRWWRRLRGIKKIWYFLGICAFMGLMFLYASLANQKGNFSIILSGEMIDWGFELCDDGSFADPRIRLKTNELKNTDACSLAEIPLDVEDYPGSHNTENTIIYTFWLRNAGEAAVDFDWYLVLNESTQNVAEATWLMVFEEGLQTIYAKPDDEGNPETVEGYEEAYFMDVAADPENQYQIAADGSTTIRTTPYVDKNTVAQSLNLHLKPGEMRKYTVVIWVEGNDPDCTDELTGGHAGYSFRIVEPGDTDSIRRYSGHETSDSIEELREEDESIFGSLLKKFRKK